MKKKFFIIITVIVLLGAGVFLICKNERTPGEGTASAESRTGYEETGYSGERQTEDVEETTDSAPGTLYTLSEEDSTYEIPESRSEGMTESMQDGGENTCTEKRTAESTEKRTAESTEKFTQKFTEKATEKRTAESTGAENRSTTEVPAADRTTESETAEATEAETTEQAITYANALAALNNVTVVPENLGSAVLTARYGSNGFAKNIWDMQALNGRVFICCGDYESNTGSTPVYYYTNDSAQPHITSYTSSSGAVSTGGLNTEAVERFFIMDGSLYALATDPLGQPAYAAYYKYIESSNTWKEYAAFPYGIHFYDMIEYDGRIFFSGSVYNAGFTKVDACVQVMDKTDLCTDVKAENVYFYTAGGKKLNSDASSNEYLRVYDMFVYKNELYAIHAATAPVKSGGLFKYDRDKNIFVQVYDGTAIRGVGAVANYLSIYTVRDYYFNFEDNKAVFGKLKVGIETLQSDNNNNLFAKFTVGNKVVLVKNGIFKAEGVENFSKVSLGSGCENYVVRDAFELDGKYYFLASEMKGTDNYVTTVFETDSDFSTFRRVISMTTQSFARSFVYNDGYLYIGLGSNIEKGDLGYSSFSGTVLRVNLENASA